MERKNRKLLGIFRTCLIEATQGTGRYKELWCIGLEHAAMASNQAPEAGSKSPAQKIGAREWSFQDDFQVFGAAVSAWEPLEQRGDKLEQVAGRAIWLGLSQVVSGAHVVSSLQWDPDINQWCLSKTFLARTVQINNNKFPLQLVASQQQVDYSSFDQFVDQFSPNACGSNVYVVQKVLDARLLQGKTQYLVKWDGVRSAEWNDADMVIHYGGERHIKAFLKKQANKDKRQINACVLTCINRLENEETKLKNLTERIRKAVQAMKTKHSKWGYAIDEDKMVDAYFKEYMAVTTQRMEEITGVERERVLKQEKVVRLRMNIEIKRDGRVKFRCIVMGHTEPKEWSEGGTDSPVASAESARLLVFSGEQCEENEHEVIGAVDIDTAFLQGIEYGEGDRPRYVALKMYKGAPLQVFKLKGSLYGQREASMRWYQTLAPFVESLGYKKGSS